MPTNPAPNRRKNTAAPKWRKVLLSLMLDVLLTGVALVIFAYFHHVRPRAIPDDNIIVARPTRAVLATPEASATPGATQEATPVALAAQTTPAAVMPTPFVYSPEMDEIGSFRVKYRDYFTDGAVESGRTETDDYYYKSANLNVTLTRTRPTVDGRTCTVYITDFYISDISCLRTGFAHDNFAKGEYEWLNDIALRQGAITAINGDFASMRNYGIVVREGHVYRSSHSSFDACAINWDGTMRTYVSKEWDGEKLIKDGAYIAWSFGPKLLDDEGKPLSKFNATDAVLKPNPRTAIGYYEPGHYCFVVVDGRSEISRGFSMSELSKFMSSLGCKQAYNLDGGESSSLWWQGEIVSKPYEGGRKISDAVILGEPTEGLQ